MEEPDLEVENDIEELGLAEIPKRIFVKFFEKLVAAGTAPEVVARLQKVILEEEKLSEKTIRPALFPEDDSEA
jgi:hypothetical protein